MAKSVQNAAVVSSLQAFLVNPLLVETIEGINPRKNLDLDDLKKYIRNNGITSLPPIKVFEREGTLFLAEGHRRLAASQELVDEGLPIAGLPAMWADKRDTGSDRLLLNNLTSNQGKALEPLEVAEGIKRLVDFGHKQSAIANLLGKTAGWVTQQLSLLDASEEVKAAIESGQIAATTAQTIIAAGKAASSDTATQNETQAAKLADVVAQKAANKAAKAANKGKGTRTPRPASNKPDPSLSTLPTGKLATPTQDDTDPSMIALNAQLAKSVHMMMQSYTLQRILTEFLNYESKVMHSANVAAIRTCIAHINGNEASTKLPPSASKVQPVVHIELPPSAPVGETDVPAVEETVETVESNTHTLFLFDNNVCTIKTGQRGKPGVWEVIGLPTKKNPTIALKNAKGDTRLYGNLKKVSPTEYQGVVA